MNAQHQDLLFAAKQVCLALTDTGFQALGQRAQVAIVQLAIYAGMTKGMTWWPAWLPPKRELARIYRGEERSDRCDECGCPVGSADCQKRHP